MMMQKNNAFIIYKTCKQNLQTNKTCKQIMQNLINKNYVFFDESNQVFQIKFRVHKQSLIQLVELRFKTQFEFQIQFFELDSPRLESNT